MRARFKVSRVRLALAPFLLHSAADGGGVASLNSNVKRTQFEGVGDATLRAVRRNTFTYLVSAFALVSENLRSMLSFFKKELAQKNLTAKNKKIATVFWQDDAWTVEDTRSLEPPG